MTTWHVHPLTGDDNFDGSEKSPFETIDRALEFAQPTDIIQVGNPAAKQWFRLTNEEANRLNPPPDAAEIVEDDDGNDWCRWAIGAGWMPMGHVPQPRTRLGWFCHNIMHGLMMRYPWHKVIGWSFWYSFVEPLSEIEPGYSITLPENWTEDNEPSPPSQGWECPRCRTIHAPSVLSCDCPPVTVIKWAPEQSTTVATSKDWDG